MDVKTANDVPTVTKRAEPAQAFGTREAMPTDAVPSWQLLEVPITYSEARLLYGLKGTDGRPDLIMRALLLRYIYGGESVRREMMGGEVLR